MSLINSMLAGLEERQAYRSEGRDLVFEGLTSVNDDNFHHANRRTNIFLPLALSVVLAGVFIIYQFQQTVSEKYNPVTDMPTVAPAHTVTNPKSTAASAAIPNQQGTTAAAMNAAPAVSEDKSFSLRMDYRLTDAREMQPPPVVQEAATQPPVVKGIETQAPAEQVRKPDISTSEISVPASSEPAILAIGIDLFEGKSSMVKLDMSRKPDYRIYELNKPARVVVEFNQNLQLPKGLPLDNHDGIVSKVRAHHLGNKNNSTVLVFELTVAGRVQVTEVIETTTGYELAIQIAPVNQTVTSSTTTPAMSAKEPMSQGATEVYKPKPGTISVTKTQNEPDELLNNGLRLYQKGQIQEGLAQVSMALELGPRDTAIRSALVNMLIEQNRITDALEILGQGIAVLPAHYNWMKLQAQLLVRLNRHNEAIAVLSKSGPDVNSDPDYYALLAGLLQQQGRNEQAILYYRNVVNAKKDNGVWWLGLGISLERVGDKTQALDAYQFALNDPSLSSEIKSYVKNRLTVLAGP